MRKRNKAWLTLVVALAMLAAACGSDTVSDTTTAADDTGTTTTEAMSTTTTQGDSATTMAADDLEFYFVGATSSQSFSIEQSLGAEQAGAEYGVGVTAVAPADPVDFATQIQLFNDAILEQPDGIVLFTLGPDQFVRPAADAVDAGIPLLMADVPLEGYPTVTNDNVGMGTRLAEYVMSDVPSDANGTVVLGIPSAGLSVLEQRAEGIKEYVNANFPNLEVLGPFETTTDPTQNTQIWTDLVASNPDAVAFFGTGDQDSPSLAQVRRTNGGDWKNAAFDLNDTALEAIQTGDLDAIGDPQHFLKGYVGIALLVENVRDGRELPPPAFEALLITLDNVINADNVDAIIERQTSPEARTAWYQDQIDEILSNPLIINP